LLYDAATSSGDNFMSGTVQQHLILSAIGGDRPGLVAEVSQFIFARGGNIEDSRMVNLRGQFAMMVLVGGPQEAVKKIQSDLPTLALESRLHVELHTAQQEQPTAATARPYRLRASAMDQSGLVHRLAHCLHTMQVNIENCDTHLAAAPYTGAPVFDMELMLAVPQATPIARLRAELGKLCNELNIDWELKEEN
jgi:glycine cleavage system transcriptional repressor